MDRSHRRLRSLSWSSRYRLEDSGEQNDEKMSRGTLHSCSYATFFRHSPSCCVRSLLTISVMTFQTRLECTVALIIHNRIWTFWLLETLAESLSWSFRYGKPTRTPGALYPRLRNLMNTFIYTSLSDLFLIQSLV